MKTFSILEPPDGSPDKVAFIREGFSWGAFLLSVLWALWHRMWVIALLLFVVFAALAVAAKLEVIRSDLAALVQFAIVLLFGFEARNLQAQALERTGFRHTGLIQATSLEAAELTYFAGRAPDMAAPAPSRLRAAPDDTLGIFGNV